MISKNNITRCAKTIKQLINRCESYGEFDKEGNLHLAVEKTETSSLKISKDKLNELDEHDKEYDATIELVKSHYLIVSVKQQIGFVPVLDYNSVIYAKPTQNYFEKPWKVFENFEKS